MSSSRPLLHRLEHPRASAERDLPGDVNDLLDSVCQHLQLMLNTRQGNCQTVPDYGIGDFSEITRGTQSTMQAQEEIRRSIEKYEPRLCDVQVSFREEEGKPFTMHFDITGKLRLPGQNRSTVFRSTVENNGEIRVKRGD